MIARRILLIAFTTFLITAPVTAQDATARKVKQILQTRCYYCHGEDGAAEGGLNFILDFDRLVATKQVVPKEPLIFLNGNIAEAEDTRISPFDRGFLWGDGIYEVTPCFGRNLYRLQDHVDRLYRSLSYVRIDPGLSPLEMVSETERLLSENQDRLGTDAMYRVGHWVTRGVDDPSMMTSAAGPAWP